MSSKLTLFALFFIFRHYSLFLKNMKIMSLILYNFKNFWLFKKISLWNPIFLPERFAHKSLGLWLTARGLYSTVLNIVFEEKDIIHKKSTLMFKFWGDINSQSPKSQPWKKWKTMKRWKTITNDEKQWTNDGKRWRAMENDEIRWKTLKYNGKQWNTMENGEIQWKKDEKQWKMMKYDGKSMKN